jgi:hypothetical protein
MSLQRFSIVVAAAAEVLSSGVCAQANRGLLKGLLKARLPSPDCDLGLTRIIQIELGPGRIRAS